MSEAFVLGLLVYTPVYGWVLTSIGIYSEATPTTMGRMYYVNMFPDHEFKARTWTDAVSKAMPLYKHLRTQFHGVKFLNA